MEKVEWRDVQGLVRSGFLDLPHAAYILWRFSADCAPQAKKRWLRNLANRLVRAEHDDSEDADVGDGQPPRRLRPRSVVDLKQLKGQATAHNGSAQAIEMVAVNMALTASGLKALGVEGPELAYFSAEFREGMAPKPSNGSAVPRRSNLLGDIDRDSPDYWEWGGWKDEAPIDGIILLYAADAVALKNLIADEESSMASAAQPIKVLYGRLYDDFKEHFGFRDGISQPAIEGTTRANCMSRKQARISRIKPGEFVLGYLNERGAKVSYSGPRQSPARDLARNGTYLVFRQLEQHVEIFDKFISEAAKLVYGTVNCDTKEDVAAQLVGRRRTGEPLIAAPANYSGDLRKRNDFLYHFEDRFGLACPIGAHIRRANPRDTLSHLPDTALRLSKMHRIIRRGRIYGQRLTAEPDRQMQSTEHRGLHFICLNADIAGQFEMVQHTWLNGTHFNGLDHETDPISHYRAGPGIMTFQHRPTNLRIAVPKLVTVRGGAYFFLPGIRALRSLAGLSLSHEIADDDQERAAPDRQHAVHRDSPAKTS